MGALFRRFNFQIRKQNVVCAPFFGDIETIEALLSPRRRSGKKIREPRAAAKKFSIDNIIREHLFFSSLCPRVAHERRNRPDRQFLQTGSAIETGVLSFLHNDNLNP